MDRGEHVRLPNGLRIWAANVLEAHLLYREICTERTYARHGIHLVPGATVFDVGANVGLYAIDLSRQLPDARIRCFEPVPSTFAWLGRNLADHAAGIVAINAALGAAAGVATFDVDRYSSVTGSMRPADFARASRQDASLAQWAAAALADLNRARPSGIARVLRAALLRRWSRPVALALIAPIAAGLELRKRLSLRRERCRVSTLSAELAASGFDRLDLAKIDVEGAEEEVLAGIADADWPRIRQLVIEVHDVEGRVARISAALRSRGYAVIQDREDWSLHELMGIFTLYAIRRSDGATAA